ncbi:MAG TPA: redoxin domain-containing protein [Nitratifractor sp.]|nr:redoxin domain-containing protein [Nitratifractor sp.]HHD74416.1 redoxin domain-containing protein [Nitratifractor sp.]HHH20606.1 redoxin domain-containing protein [Nitratifractor sp.]
MKKWIKEILTMAIVLIVASSAIGYYRGMSVNSNLDTLQATTTLDAKSVKAILSSNKPLIINFWGTWCPICNQEVSTLSKLAKRDDIILLTVAVNSGSNQDIEKYMQKKGINFLVINDNNGKIAKSFNVETFPTTLFFGKSRKKVIKDSGYTTYPGFLARIKLADNE